MKSIFHTLTLLLFPIFVLAQNSSIRGVVKDENELLPGVIVSFENEKYNTVTDLEGNFVLPSIPQGKHLLRIAALGYHTLHVSLVIYGDTNLGAIALQRQSLNEVQITANIKGSETKALNMMKASTVFANIVSAEGIAKLPDRNVAEAIQRLPGVVMESDQGEGRFISFRGTPNDWSTALVNGSRMPVADESSKSRAMNFDIFPSTMVDYIVVSKTLSPDMEGDAIGGSANFLTKNPPAVKTAQASIGAGYNAQAQKPIYNGTLSFGSRTKNGKLGYLVGGSLYNRNWATDNYQVFYGSNIDHSLTRLELRDYEGKRTTLGFNGAIDYKFSDQTKVYAKVMYGHMTDNEYNRKTMYNWSTGWGQSIKLQNIHNIMLTNFMGGELGGDFKAHKKVSVQWKLASYSNAFQYGKVPYSKNDDRNGYHVAEFEKAVQFTDFLYLDEHGNVTDEINAVNRMKVLDIDSPIPGYGDHYNNIQPRYKNVNVINANDTMFALTRAYSETNQTYEKDPIVAQTDIQYKINNSLNLKFGAKLRMKQGERKVGLALWERSKDYSSPILYNNYGPVAVNEKGGFLQELGSPYKGQAFPFLDGKTLDGFVENLGDTLKYIPFGVNTPYIHEVVGSSYRYKENVYAAYIMGEWSPIAGLSILPGVRTEYTAPEVRADSILTTDKSLGTIALTEVKAGKAYLSILPMVNAKYAINDQQNIRLAIARSFRRPNFNEIKPGAASIDYSNFDLVYGNPDLKPTYSWNFDAAYERFLGATSMFSAAVFYKAVTNHIYTAFESTDADNTGIANEFQIPGGVVAKRFQNAPTAFALGFEASLMTKFRFLPGILKNIGINVNYAYTHSRMKIDSRNQPQQLPRQAPSVVNTALFFENNKLNIRLGLNYRDPYLYELNLYAVKDPNSTDMIVAHQNNDFDIYIGKSLTVDFSTSYKIGRHFSVFAELNNVTNTPYKMYRGREERPIKTEYYSLRGLTGLRFEL